MWCIGMTTSLGMPSVWGSRFMRATSQRQMQAAVARVSACDAPQVTMPASAWVFAAMTRLAAA